MNYTMKHFTIKKDSSFLIIQITNALVAIAEFVKNVTLDHVSTDQSHGRISFSALLSQYRSSTHGVAPPVLPQVYLNL